MRGQGGVTITEFQAQSGARIQLSRSREFFPGTGDRILLLTGTVNAILTALHLILSKLLTEEPSGARREERRGEEARRGEEGRVL